MSRIALILFALFLPLSTHAATCNAGYAFNISSDSCNTCAPGKYSDGTAMILDPENDIPNSFIPEHPDSGSTWSINFDNTTVSGTADCSQSPDTFISDASGDYCWCKVTTTTDVNWVYVYDYGYAEDGYCATICSHACAYFNYRYEDIRRKIYPSAGCKSCTNAPANAHYTGSGTTATNCPWQCDAGYYLENGACVGCDRVGDYCPGDNSKYACPDSQIISSNDIDIVSTRILSWGCGSNNATGLDCCVKTGNWTSNGGYGYYSRYYNQSSNAYTGGLTLYTYAYTGYYMSRAYSYGDYWYDVKPCTNAPANAHYTGAGTPDSVDGTIVDANDCPWECDAGYGQTAGDTCEPLCTAGMTKLHTSNGLSFNIYANKLTTPALNLSRNNNVCYVSLSPGMASGAINIQHGDTVYHTIN